MTPDSDHTSARHCCEGIAEYLSIGTLPLTFNGKFREYGIRVNDGGSSYIVIDFCPWCGRRFEPTLRYKWLDEIRALGFEPDSPHLPARFTTDEWWSGRASGDG